MQNRAKKIDKKKDRVFGYAKGKITLKPGFDDPIEDLVTGLARFFISYGDLSGKHENFKPLVLKIAL